MQRRRQALEKRSKDFAHRLNQEKSSDRNEGRHVFDEARGDLSENLHCRAECREAFCNDVQSTGDSPGGTSISSRKLSLSTA
jgi:hypothetical protein